MIDKSKWRVTETEFLMGRDKQDPLTPEMHADMEKMLIAANLLRDVYGKPLVVSSGYRPAAVNAATPGAAKKSNHMLCRAIDFEDKDRKLTNWLVSNIAFLESAGLWMESPLDTPTWAHVQIVPPASGKRIFRA